MGRSEVRAPRRVVALSGSIAMAAALLAGCASATASWQAPQAAAEPTATTTPAATTAPTSSPTPRPSPTVALVLSVDGLGPYKLGVSTIATLTTGGLVSQVTPYYPDVCTGIQTALGTGDYTGRFTLYFKDDLLVAIVTGASEVKSASGARVGMAGTQVEKIYGSRVKTEPGYGGVTIYTVAVDTERRLVMRNSGSSPEIAEMFVQKGAEPVLVPRDGPAC